MILKAPVIAGLTCLLAALPCAAEDHAAKKPAPRLTIELPANIGDCLKTLEAWRKLSGTTPDQARANLLWALLNHNDFVTLR